MANEKQTGATATKRATTPTTKTTVRSPRAGTKTEASPTTEPVTATLPATEPISPAKATVAPARKTVLASVTTESSPTIHLDAVRRRAYELYVERGRLDGYHEQDWYTAEQELRGRKQSRSQNGSRKADSQRSA